MVTTRRDRIGIDVDGVLADLLSPMLILANHMFDLALTPEDMPTHELDDYLPPQGVDHFWKAVGTPGFIRDLVPYPGAVEGLKMLREEGAEIYIVTSYLRGAAQWVHERDQWIAEHFGIDRKRMIHTPAKHTFSAAMLVDDRPDNVEPWAAEAMRTRHPAEFPAGILWARSYNARHVVQEPNVMRTDSWAQVAGAWRAVGVRYSPKTDA